MIIWKFHIRHPHNIYFQLLPCLSHILVASPQNKRRKEKRNEKRRNIKSNLCCPMEHGQTPSCLTLKDNISFPAPSLLETINYENLSQVYLRQFLSIIFNDFLFRLFLIFREGGCFRSLLCHSFSTLSLKISISL